MHRHPVAESVRPQLSALAGSFEAATDALIHHLQQRQEDRQHREQDDVRLYTETLGSMLRKIKAKDEAAYSAVGTMSEEEGNLRRAGRGHLRLKISTSWRMSHYTTRK